MEVGDGGIVPKFRFQYHLVFPQVNKSETISSDNQTV